MSRIQVPERLRLPETFTATTEWLAMAAIVAAAVIAVLMGI
ncbi:MAG TPA: hypothetical protein VMC10_14815 [Stellaceae bacterium]|nr:hypothetical protein [Stellaceae bacterium]